MTSNYDKANMKNTFKFAGTSLTKGKFFSGGTSFVVGAPKANNYRGAVYVCKDCFGRNRFASGHMTVEGIQMGEGFGTSAAACDINGDGFDDVVVGAPLHSKKIEVSLKFCSQIFNTNSNLLDPNNDIYF